MDIKIHFHKTIITLQLHKLPPFKHTSKLPLLLSPPNQLGSPSYGYPITTKTHTFKPTPYITTSHGEGKDDNQILLCNTYYRHQRRLKNLQSAAGAANPQKAFILSKIGRLRFTNLLVISTKQSNLDFTKSPLCPQILTQLVSQFITRWGQHQTCL